MFLLLNVRAVSFRCLLFPTKPERWDSVRPKSSLWLLHAGEISGQQQVRSHVQLKAVRCKMRGAHSIILPWLKSKASDPGKPRIQHFGVLWVRMPTKL